jgi:hypothetical protein
VEQNGQAGDRQEMTDKKIYINKSLSDLVCRPYWIINIEYLNFKSLS